MKPFSIPENCMIKRHKTSMEGIIFILEDGETKDTETLLKDLYNEEKWSQELDDLTGDNKLVIYRFHGFSQRGPITLNRSYNDKTEIFNSVKKQLQIAPKGHYVYVDRHNWNKGLPCPDGKLVNIYYRWDIDKNFDNRTIKVRDFEDETTPNNTDTSSNSLPVKGGEIVYPEGFKCSDMMCITAPSNYKLSSGKWKEWSDKLEKLCKMRNIKLYWVSPGSKTSDTVLQIYNNYKEKISNSK